MRPPTGPRPRRPHLISNGVTSPMVKAKWSTKRTCPKCATRFYDLGNDDPITCVACGINWHAEPVLKSKQPMPFEAAKPEIEVEKEDADLAAVDLGGDDDIGVPGAAGDDEEV